MALVNINEGLKEEYSMNKSFSAEYDFSCVRQIACADRFCVCADVCVCDRQTKRPVYIYTIRVGSLVRVMSTI